MKGKWVKCAGCMAVINVHDTAGWFGQNTLVYCSMTCLQTVAKLNKFRAEQKIKKYDHI